MPPVVAPPPAPSQDVRLSTCPSCETPGSGPYCAQCGERIDRSTDYSLRRFAAEALHTFTHLADRRIVRSLRALLLQPGRLTEAFMDGQRVRFVAPFRLFLVVNVVFFLAASLNGGSPLSTKLRSHLTSQNFFHVETARTLVAGQLGEDLKAVTPAFEAYEARFNRRVEVLSKSLVLVQIPVFALLLGLVFVWRREYLVKHFVFACHTYAFLLLVSFFVLVGLTSLVIALTGLDLSPTATELLLSLVTLIGQTAFLAVGLWRAYGLRWWLAVPGGLLLALAMYQILLLYRALLFFAAFYTL